MTATKQDYEKAIGSVPRIMGETIVSPSLIYLILSWGNSIT